MTAELPFLPFSRPTIDEDTIAEPTYWSEGLKHITQQCTKCDYHREYDRAIPRKQVVVSSGGGVVWRSRNSGGSWEPPSLSDSIFRVADSSVSKSLIAIMALELFPISSG